jgi:hypothetical protein
MRLTAGALLLVLATLTVARDRLGESFTRPLGFQLGSMNLAAVRQRLGPATMRHTGDAGESEYSVCYEAPRSGVHIVFMSGELGGSDHELLGFNMKAVGAVRSEHCLSLAPDVEKSLTFTIGRLQLGIAPEAFRRVVGKASAREEGVLVAEFDYQDPMPPSQAREARRLGRSSEPWNTLITLEAKFIKDKLAEISVWRVVTQ